MEKRTCKLCFHSFASGRALGGHMRSHVAAAAAVAVTAAAAAQTALEESLRMAGSSASTEESVRSRGISLVDEASDFVAQDHESETGSSPLATSATVKTIRQRLATLPQAELAEPESLSTVSHTTSVEEAALNLMMLSHDSWTRAPAGKSRRSPSPATAARERVRYQCVNCKKVFPSHQALGGHRATRKKSRCCAAPQTNAAPSGDGERKRSQSTSPTSQPPFPSPQVNSPVTAAARESFPDLNLPAPMDEFAGISAASDPTQID
ncbi:Zinc finger protein ZAT4 [Apostasia shenzhenica]|uniref:Zinc finger protein ZAT4 n=1 Tax=Apostasia shenzhenica TaxID=1088818 RepID=A0A2I0AZW3_9ASPA|nr:Zinc finger protein ZAT4 [Apostasia shenzhenica]